MVQPSHSRNSDEELPFERPVSPIHDSQGSETSCIEVNTLEQMGDRIINEDIGASTQAILELPAAAAASPKKKIVKGKGTGKGNLLKQKKAVRAMNFFLWLKSYWDSESTIQIMGKFVTAIKKHALETQNFQLGRLVRPMNAIMKEFILFMDKQKQSLKKISWESFESWALNHGLSTMYSNGQSMVWEADFNETLYRIYGQCYLQTVEEMDKETSEEEDEPSSALPTTKTTSMSSMTARTQEEAADVDLCDISRSSSLKRKQVTFQVKPGSSTTKSSILKSKTKPKKLTTVSEKPRKAVIQSDTEEEESQEEADLEHLMDMPAAKKAKKAQQPERRDSSESENGQDSDNLRDMLDAAVQAQCLMRTTGSISQFMSLKHQDNVITLKSRGERGAKVVKFEIYPYSDCLRREKQEWWRYAEMRSLFLQYSENSRVAKLMEQLTKEVFKQIQQTKKVEIKSAVYKHT